MHEISNWYYFLVCESTNRSYTIFFTSNQFWSNPRKVTQDAPTFSIDILVLHPKPKCRILMAILSLITVFGKNSSKIWDWCLSQVTRRITEAKGIKVTIQLHPNLDSLHHWIPRTSFKVQCHKKSDHSEYRLLFVSYRICHSRLLYWDSQVSHRTHFLHWYTS